MDLELLQVLDSANAGQLRTLLRCHPELIRNTLHISRCLRRNDPEMLKIFLECDPNLINLRFEDRISIFHLAIQISSPAIVRFLANTAPHLINQKGGSPHSRYPVEDIPIYCHDFQLVRAIFDHNRYVEVNKCRKSILSRLAFYGQIDSIKFVVWYNGGIDRIELDDLVEIYRKVTYNAVGYFTLIYVRILESLKFLACFLDVPTSTWTELCCDPIDQKDDLIHEVRLQYIFTRSLVSRLLRFADRDWKGGAVRREVRL